MRPTLENKTDIAGRDPAKQERHTESHKLGPGSRTRNSPRTRTNQSGRRLAGMTSLLDFWNIRTHDVYIPATILMRDVQASKGRAVVSLEQKEFA